ncbi:hypothetical protein JNUCC1_00649 [Lentibacillus sp. JNUCC-1]|nr:hypothetical protein [Lentibacillus sp. JNUCC-1]
MPAASRHCESDFLEQMSHLSCDKVKATVRSGNHPTLVTHTDLSFHLTARTSFLYVAVCVCYATRIINEATFSHSPLLVKLFLFCQGVKHTS